MMRLTRVMLNLSFCYSIVKAQSSGKSKAARANAPSRLRQSMATAGSELRIDWVKKVSESSEVRCSVHVEFVLRLAICF